MFEYKAIVQSVYDGDTFRANVDLGFNSWLMNINFRMTGIDAPEMRGAEKIDGTVSRDRLRELILGREIIIKTKKDSQEKYGRWLAKVYLSPTDVLSVNEQLISENLAVKYMD